MNKDAKRKPVQRRSDGGPKAGSGYGKPQTRRPVHSEPLEAPVVKAPVVLPPHRRQDVIKCSACGEDHTRVLFHLREGWETLEYPYRAKCPISGKEVLLKVGG